MPVVVVTDSSSRLPASLAEHYGILRVPLHLTLPDGRDFREDVDSIPGTIISAPNVTTAGANVAELTDAFRRAVERSRGDGVVAVHMSRQLSGTWSNARLAAQEFDGQVRVIDSRTAGQALGLAVIGAAQAAQRGADRDAVYEAAIRAAASSESLLCVATLENLRASGRISAAGRMLGSALSIKPILHITDGQIQLLERQRTQTKALAKMVEAVVDLAGADPVTLGVQHSLAPEDAGRLHDTLRARIPRVTSSMIVPMGPVLGTHVGPGALGVSLVSGLEPIAEVEGS